MPIKQLEDCLAQLRDARKELLDKKPKTAIETAHTALEDYLKWLVQKAGATSKTTVPNQAGIAVPYASWGFWQLITYLEQQKCISPNLKDAFSHVNTLRVDAKHHNKIPTPDLVSKAIMVIEYAVRSTVVGRSRRSKSRKDRGNLKIDMQGYDKWQKFEIRVRTLLKLLKFQDHIADVYNFNYKVLGPQIDACGGEGATFFVFDCTSKEKLGTKSIRAKIRDTLSKEKQIAKNIDKRHPGKYPQKVFVICFEDIEITPEDRDYAEENDVMLVDSDQIKYWFKYYPMLGPALKYHIVKSLGGNSAVFVDTQQDPFIRFRAFRIQDGGKTAYYFLADPETLTQLAYVYRLEATDPAGYQRNLDINKLKKINSYLKEQSNYFPNNLVLCFDSISDNKKWPDFYPDQGPLPGGHAYGTLCLPKVYCSGEVIDGQHRLYGYFDASDEQKLVRMLRERRQIDRLSIVAVADPNTENRARLFVDINSNQTKVNVRRTWALTARVHPNSEMGYVAQIVIMLNGEGVFKNRIEIPGISKKREINIANFGKGLLDRGFFRKEHAWSLYHGNRTPNTPYSQKRLPQSAKELEKLFRPFRKGSIGKFLYTNNGANVLARVLAEVLKYEAKPGRKVKRPRINSAIKSAFLGVLKKTKGRDRLQKLIRRLSSEGERGSVAQDMIGSIRRRKGLSSFGDDIFV